MPPPTWRREQWKRVSAYSESDFGRRNCISVSYVFPRGGPSNWTAPWIERTHQETLRLWFPNCFRATIHRIEEENHETPKVVDLWSESFDLSESSDTSYPRMEKIMRYRTAIGFAFVTMSEGSGCGGGVAGARPSDMSEKEHESAAEQHEHEAAGHAQQYDPKAVDRTYTDCAQYLGSCWSSNPTEEHKKQAEEHLQAAAAHRAAARGLGDAEARACQGVSEADRDISPFFHREAIMEVKPLSRVAGVDERRVDKPAGATIVLLPAPGVTAERLERIVQCHIARNTALNNDVPEMPYCPLVPKGVSATVTSAGNGFAVNVSAADEATAAEVLRRARALAPR